MKCLTHRTLFAAFLLFYSSGVAIAEVLVATGSEIVKVSEDGTGATTFVSNATYGMFYDSVGEKLYFTGSGDSIRRADRDGSNTTTLVASAGSTVVDLVIDRVSTPAKIIWTDLNGFRIRRSNLDGTSVEDIVTGISDPHGITIDSLSGKIYWSDALGISKSNLNGTSQELTFITDFGGPIRYLLLHEGKIYWTNATDNTVKRANVDGSSVETIRSTGADVAEGIAYETTLGKLFYIGHPTGGVGLRKMDLDGSNLVTLGSQTGYDILVNYSSSIPTPTPTVTPSNTPTATPTHTPTATPTHTPTVIPTNTPVPTPTDIPYDITEPPTSLCLTYRGGTLLAGLLGDYTRVSFKTFDNSFEYRKATGEQIVIAGIFELFSSIDFRLLVEDGTLYIKSNQVAPLGTYNGSFKGKKGSRTTSVDASPGQCPAGTPTPVPTNSIVGKVNSTGSSPTVNIFDTTSNIYALLFSGLTPSDSDGTGIPISGALVQNDGSFTFENITPGEYHITFLADDVRFASEYVSVTAITSGATTAPEVSATIVNFRDSGCTKKDQSSNLYSSTNSLVSIRDELLKQIADNELLGYQNLTDKKEATFISKLSKLNSQTTKIYSSATKKLTFIPSVSRINCPKANKCKVKSLAKNTAALKDYFEKLHTISISVAKLSSESISSKKSKSTNSKHLKNISKLYRAGLKSLAKLPAENQTCPES